MRPKIAGLTDAIRQVLESKTDSIHWKQICNEIKEKNLVDINPQQEEITYGQPNFHHSVRRIISELIKRGEVVRISRGIYQKVK
jgi:predicted transcriptional regulator of viral defense system